MKVLEVKMIEKDVTVTYNFFRVQNEKEFKNVVVFENGYTEGVDYIAGMLKFETHKQEIAFKKSWSNAKRLELINQNIEVIMGNYPKNFFS